MLCSTSASLVGERTWLCLPVGVMAEPNTSLTLDEKLADIPKGFGDSSRSTSLKWEARLSSFFEKYFRSMLFERATSTFFFARAESLFRVTGGGGGAFLRWAWPKESGFRTGSAGGGG